MRVILLSTLIPVTGFALDGYYSGDPSRPYVPEYGPFAPTDATVYIPLSGIWRVEDPRGTVQEVVVPGCWRAGIGIRTFRTKFRIPEDLRDHHLRLVLWGAKRKLSIKLNNRLVETWEGDWPSRVIDFPRGVLNFDGSNELEIEVDDRLSALESIPLKPKIFDEVTYAGIFADVALVAGPTASSEQMTWSVDLDDEYETARWQIGIGLRNQLIVPADSFFVRNLKIHVEWTSTDSMIAGKTEEVELQLGAVEIATVNLTGIISNPKLWSVDRPNLYRFKVIIKEGNDSWYIPLHSGLAEVSWHNDGLKLNGDLLRIRGVDLRQENLKRGASMTAEEIEADIKRAKSLGFNLVRIVGAPPLLSTADICDRLGMLLIPQTGMKGVPAGIFNSVSLQSRLEKFVLSMIAAESHHPSIVAWGIGENLPPSGIFESITHLVESAGEIDDRPLLVGIASGSTPGLPEGVVGIRQRPPYHMFQPLKPLDDPPDPWLIGGIGGFYYRSTLKEDSMDGQVRQSDASLRQLKSALEMKSAGFIIDCLADRQAAWPLLIRGSERADNWMTRGLLTAKREDRIAWQKVGEAMGRVRIEVPTLNVAEPGFPLIFPMATLMIGGFLLLTMRQNNVFRQNLKRVFAHTHGFFVDIRDRRYFQTGQIFIIGIIICASQAVLTVGALHHARTSFTLDYLMTLFIPVLELKRRLILWSWNPLEGIVAFTAIYFILLIILALALSWISLPFKGKLRLRQSFTLVSWGATNFLLMMPIGLVQYRLLDYSWFLTVYFIIYALFAFWYINRIVSIIRIGYQISSRAAWLLLLTVFAVMTALVVAFYNRAYAITDYLDYYSTVIVPWVTG